MARMIPDVDPDTIADPAEAVVYRQLRDQLPGSWTVRHSFAFCWMDRGMLRDAEVDFIIIAPDRGLLVLEVKGSHGYACRDGIWHKVNKDGSEERARDPFQQATVAKHRVVGRVAERVFSKSKAEFPGVYGHLVVYPFGRVRGPLPTSAEPVLVVSYEDMPRLFECTEDAFAAWGSRSGGAAFTPEVASRVASFFAENSSLVPVLAADIDADDRKIEALTLLQYGAFHGILGNGRAHVRGPAGSGKTLIAGWAARELSAQGLRVLFLCYNRVLASWLPRPDEYPAPFETRSFFSVCHDLVRRAGISFDPPDEEAQDFWTRVAPAKMCDALEVLPAAAYSRYDAVIVDEGQDFHQDWWLPVQLLLKDPDRGRLYLFSDPEQTGVYGQRQAVPSPLVSFDLRENCRNTGLIAEYCSRVINIPCSLYPGSPRGVAPIVLPFAADPRARAAAVRACVADAATERVDASRLAILSPWKRTNAQSAMRYLSVIGGKPIDGGDLAIAQWRRGDIFWESTIRAFKGLEADWIIVSDAPSVGSPGFGLADLYVAASRAKHRLVIVPNSSEAEVQLRSWSAARSGT